MSEFNRSECRNLRTKATYTTDSDPAELWRNDSSSTGQYWCLLTMSPIGPDEQLVTPGTCQGKRDCFKKIG